jgi:hypothetical protein
MRELDAVGRHLVLVAGDDIDDQSPLRKLIEGRGLLRQHQRRGDPRMHRDDELHAPGQRNEG